MKNSGRGEGGGLIMYTGNRSNFALVHACMHAMTMGTGFTDLHVHILPNSRM